MLDLGFMPDVQKVSRHPTMPSKKPASPSASEVATATRQTLMFSATFPEEVRERQHAINRTSNSASSQVHPAKGDRFRGIFSNFCQCLYPCFKGEEGIRASRLKVDCLTDRHATLKSFLLSDQFETKSKAVCRVTH